MKVNLRMPISAFAAAAVTGFFSLGALAQAPEQDQDATQIAQTGFEEGAKAYLGGNYETAIVIWQKAYAIWPAAIITYNMSLAAAKLENYGLALVYAEQAEKNLELPLDEKYQLKSQANVQAWRAQLEAERAAQALRDQEPEEVVLQWPGYVGIGAATVGTALVTGAVILASSASTKNSELLQQPSVREYNELRGEVEDEQAVGRVMLYSGLALVGTGAGLVVWDLFFDGEANFAVTGSASSAGVIMKWGW